MLTISLAILGLLAATPVDAGGLAIASTAPATRPADERPVPKADDARRLLDDLLAKRTKVYKTVTARRMKALLAEMGADAPIELVDGAPSLRVTGEGGRKFWVRLLGCPERATAASACRAVQMFVLIKPDKPVEIDVLNSFNTAYPFAKVTRLSDGTLTVEWAVSLDYGITEGNLLLNLLIWDGMVDEFLRFLNARSA